MPKISLDPLLENAGAITGAIPKEQPSPFPLILGGGVSITASPVEVYTRIATGVNRCWFMKDAVIPSGYIFHAMTAKDRSAASIAIHERGVDGGRGLKAYEVRMQQTASDTTQMETQNFRLKELVAEQVKKDIEYWAAGAQECQAKPETTAVAKVEKPKQPAVAIAQKQQGPALPIPTKAPPPPKKVVAVKPVAPAVSRPAPIAIPAPIVEQPSADSYSQTQTATQPATQTSAPSDLFKGPSF